MKKSIKWVLTSLFIVTLTTLQAQDSRAEKIKKDAAGSNKVVDKPKLDSNKGTTTGTVSKGKPVQAVGTTNQDKVENSKDAARKEMENLRKEYSNKIRATKDPKEQARLEAEMEEKMAQFKGQVKISSSDNLPNASQKLDNIKKEAQGNTKPTNPKEEAVVAKGKPMVVAKDEKVSATQAVLSDKRNNLNNSKEMLNKAKAKVAASRALLKKQKEEGTLSKEAIAGKEAKIAAAEAKVKRLEASIVNAEKKYNEKETKLSEIEKNKN
ncbi:MAG: hypothetical protein R2781_12255 [Flavobacteriaceae bacterium]